jgi:hypothetical protein
MILLFLCAVFSFACLSLLCSVDGFVSPDLDHDSDDFHFYNLTPTPDLARLRSPMAAMLKVARPVQGDNFKNFYGLSSNFSIGNPAIVKQLLDFTISEYFPPVCI